MSLNDEDRELRERIESLPRSIEPPHDLWPTIRERIAAPKVVRPDFGHGRGHWRRWGTLAAAAMALVIFSSGLTAWILRSAPADPAPATAAGQGAVTVAWEQFQAAETEYQKVTDELLRTLDARRNQLAPETVEIVETNLRLIDEAITEARAALERDPSNAALATQLTDIYRRRVGFLQQMSRL